MKRSVILGFLLLLTIDTAQQVTTKLAANRLIECCSLEWLQRVAAEPLVYIVGACYIAAFFVYMWLLKVAPVGPTYAAVHGHIVTVLIISLLFLGERMTLMQGVGCLLIVAGIIVLGVTETLEDPPERVAATKATAGAR
jgi:multidrug transporter EmrE-like cation transporter